MLPWVLSACFAALAVVLAVKMILLYRGLTEISAELGKRLCEDTNNVLYVSGNDRRLKAFAGRLNRELRALREQRHKYQNGDRELKEAVTNISHDLRTPLTAIYGYLELLEKEALPETAAHYIALIENRADAMKSLTEELFRYSVILSEEEEKREAVILNRVLEESLIAYYDILKRNKIEPDVVMPDEEVLRYLDLRSLKRIFENILSNAVKHGTEDLRVELSCDGTITFSNHAQNLDRVSVERLFDRFYTMETGKGGMGLGLSIAKLLTERMGGSISADFTAGMLTIRLKF